MPRLYVVLKYGAILFWSSFVIAPFLWALTTSFKTINGVTGGPTYIPWLQYEPSLAAWGSLFGSTGGIDIVQPYIDSIVVTFGASLISIVLGTLAAYGLSRFTYQVGPVKNADIVFFFISQRIMPPVVLAIPFFLMLQFLGKQLSQRELTLNISDAGLELLAKEGYNPAFGARPLSPVAVGLVLAAAGARL
ncbi:MAG: hypothetical protein Q7S35_09355, partial [Candidatus Limnocylindrales bacterium]|nr:hypothetical protein [Candidatus Limnocylindrales bacterium]